MEPVTNEEAARYLAAMGNLQRFQAARDGPCEVARAIRQLVA